MRDAYMDSPYGRLPKSLTKEKLGDLCVPGGVQTGPFGSQLHQEDYVDEGTPIITVEHLGDNRIVHRDLPRVSEEDRARLARYSLRTGDIVFSRVGSVDRRALVGAAEDGWLFSGRCLRVRADVEKVDPTWLSYFFGLPAFQQYVRSIAVGATMPSINTKILSDVPIYFPEVVYQRAVGQFLRTLDDKIDLNRRINQTLEAMAQAIFKSWFVDFDPVKAKIAAKAEGRDPLRAAMTAISGKPDAELDTLPPDQFAPLAATAALFPDEMKDSELGEIPKGWQVNKVGQLLELAYGKALKATDRVDGPIPVYGSGGVTGSHNTALVNHGSVIVGRKGTVGALYWEDGPFFPIDTTFYVRPVAAPMTYCFYLLQTLGLDKMNTDAAVPGLNRENVYRLEHVLPSATALKAFNSTVGLLRSAMRANTASSTSLSVLRDTLLPKLLSGELQVHNAETEAAA